MSTSMQRHSCSCFLSHLCGCGNVWCVKFSSRLLLRPFSWQEVAHALDSWETFGRRDRPRPMVTAYPSLYRSTEAFTCISREVWLLHQWTYLMMHTHMFHRNDIHVRWICISQFTITDVKWKWCILYVARWNVNMWRLGGWAGGRPVVCLAFMTVLCILLTVTTIKC